MKYFNSYRDAAVLVKLLDIISPHIDKKKQRKLFSSTNINEYTDLLLDCYEILLPEKLTTIFKGLGKLQEIKDDIKLHLIVNTSASYKLKSDIGSCIRTHQGIRKTKEVLNRIYKENNNTLKGGYDYFNDSPSNYQKKLDLIAEQLNLLLGYERGHKVRIPKPISNYVTHQALNYPFRKAMLGNMVGDDIVKNHSFATELLFQLLAENSASPDEHLMNLYLLEREFKLDMSSHILTLDYASFIDPHGACKLLALGSLLPNIISSTKLLSFFIDYKEEFSDKYYAEFHRKELHGSYLSRYRTLRSDEASWLDNVQEILLELIYYSYPLLEFIHCNLLDFINNKVAINNKIKRITTTPRRQHVIIRRSRKKIIDFDDILISEEIIDTFTGTYRNAIEDLTKLVNDPIAKDNNMNSTSFKNIKQWMNQLEQQLYPDNLTQSINLVKQWMDNYNCNHNYDIPDPSIRPVHNYTEEQLLAIQDELDLHNNVSRDDSNIRSWIDELYAAKNRFGNQRYFYLKEINNNYTNNYIIARNNK